MFRINRTASKEACRAKEGRVVVFPRDPTTSAIPLPKLKNNLPVQDGGRAITLCCDTRNRNERGEFHLAGYCFFRPDSKTTSPLLSCYGHFERRFIFVWWQRKQSKWNETPRLVTATLFTTYSVATTMRSILVTGIAITGSGILHEDTLCLPAYEIKEDSSQLEMIPVIDTLDAIHCGTKIH